MSWGVWGGVVLRGLGLGLADLRHSWAALGSSWAAPPGT